MSTRVRRKANGWASRALLAALVPSLWPMSAGAETTRIHDTYRAPAAAREQCDERENVVHVSAYGRDFCIRYYVSEDGGSGREPVVYLSGDHEIISARRNEPGERAVPGSYEQGPESQVDEREIKKITGRVRDVSRTTGTTAIYLARMGLDGSSGYHRERRTMLELSVMNAALDALKRKHDYEGFHLVGQSGGSTLIGAILALRDDIGCAVPGSGRLARLRETRPSHDPALQRLDPSSMIPATVHSKARILVVTDPRDRVVQREHQETFIEDLEEAGGHIDQFYVHARDENHHGVSDYAIFVTAGCMRGKSYEQIARTLNEQVAEKVRARKRAKAAEKLDQPKDDEPRGDDPKDDEPGEAARP